MTSFGERFAQLYPDKAAGKTAAEIDASAVASLDDPVRRPKILATARKMSAKFATAGDDVIDNAIRVHVPSGDPTQEEIKGLGEERGMKRAEAGWNAAAQRSANIADSGENTPATDAAHIKNLETMVPPGSLPDPGSGQAPPRFPVAESWSMFQAKNAEMLGPHYEDGQVVPPRKTRFVNPGILGGQVMNVDDETGEPIQMLDPSATFPPSEVEGHSVMQRLSGQASALQHGMAVAGRSAFEGKDRTQDSPGYGLPELGAQIGEQVGAGPTFQKASAQLSRGLLRTGQAIDSAEGAVGSGLEALGSDRVGPKMRQNNDEEIAQADRDIAQLQGFEDYIDSPMSDAQRADIAQQAGHYAGRALGSSLPVVADPIGRTIGMAGKAGKVVGGAVRALGATEAQVPGLAFKGLQRVAPAAAQSIVMGADKVRRAVGGALSDIPGAQAFDNVPSAAGARGIDVGAEELAPRDALRYGERVGQQRMGAARHGIQRQMEDELAGNLRDAGYDPRMARQYQQAAQQVWHDPGLRAKAPEPVRIALDTLQPYDEALFRAGQESGTINGSLQYNPLHPKYGQDPFASATKLITGEAQAAEEAGGKAWTSSVIHDDLSNVPGIRKLASNAYTPVIPKSVPESIALIEKRMTEEGGHTSREISDAIGRMKNATTSEALTDAIAHLHTHGRFAEKETADFLIHHVELSAQADPANFFHVDTILPNTTRTMERAAYGAIREGKAVFPSSVAKKLRDNDMVIIRAPKMHGEKLVTSTDRMMVINNPELNKLDGMVMPRRVGRALGEITDGNPMLPGAQRWARFLDKMLGLEQKKTIITQGNLGFKIRNDMGAAARLYGEEDTPGFFGNLGDVADISHARPDEARTIDVAGQQVSIGKLRQIMDEGNGVGHGQMEERAARAGTQHGSRLLSTAAKAAKLDVISAGASKVEKARDIAVRGLVAPGKWYGKWTNKLFTGVIADKNGLRITSLNPEYTFEDGMRMASILAKMKRGVPAERAVLDTRTLFIDYADTTPVASLLGPVFPFVKYYSGMLKGAVKIALQHPERFAKLSQVGRVMEAADQVSKGAFDPRLKPVADQLSMNPMTEQNGQATTSRIDDPLSEIGQWYAGFTGDDERGGLASMVGPAVTSPYELATGKSMVTGRNTLPLSNSQYLRGSGGEIGQLFQAAKDDEEEHTTRRLGGRGLGTMLAYSAAKGYLPEPYQAGARLALNLGASPAAATDEDSHGAAIRALVRQFTGIGTRRVNPYSEADKKNDAAKKRLPLTREEERYDQWNRGKN